MRETRTLAVVLAAGKGTRMKSDLAKVLHPVHGRPMLARVLDTLAAIETSHSVVIVGHQADAVGEVAAEHRAETALQAEQLGTGHAVLQAKAALADQDGWTLLLSGDVPLLGAETLARLRDETVEAGAAAAVLTAVAEDPTGYGRMLRNETNEPFGFYCIVDHERDRPIRV